MKAARYHIGEKSYLSIDDIPNPVPGEAEVLIKTIYSGICGSDLTRYRNLSNPPQSMRDLLGPISKVIGHEMSGEIAGLGPNVPEKWPDGASLIGSLTLAHPQVGCGECAACQSGFWAGCTGEGGSSLIGLQLNGGMAEYVVVPFSNLVRIPTDDRTKEYTLTEPLSVSWRLVRKAQKLGMTSADSIIVIGDGAIGILTSHLLVRKGFSKVKLIGRNENKLLVASNMDVSDIIFEKDVGTSLFEKEDYVFQTGGSNAAFDLGFNLLNHGGKMLTIGYLPEEAVGIPPLVYNRMIRMEKTIQGSYTYSLAEFKQAFEMINENIVDVKPLISRSIPLSRIIEDGFSTLTGKEKLAGKVLVEF
jgi:threonine dehydrogenase-like Zn-dependent dehydrogenase